MKTEKFNGVLKWLCAALLTAVLTLSCFGCADKRNEQAPPQNPDSSQEQTVPGENGGDTSEGDSSTGGESEQPGEGENNAWAENFDLPAADDALVKLAELYGGADKVFLLQNGRIARMPCPQGEVITLNMTYKVSEYAKIVLDDSIEEFNEVFAVINPNYKFAINYEPKDEDFSAEYSVRMTASDNLEVTDTREVFGLAHIGYFNNFTELGNFGITLNTKVLDNGSYLMTTFKHELMHLLGAGDAYKNSSATKATVMQSYQAYGTGYHHFSQSDVAFLNILYRNPEFDGSQEKIEEYISSYEQTTEHTKANVTALVMQKLVDNLDSQNLVSEAEAIGYKDLTVFRQAIEDGIIRDENFGSEKEYFAEIEYAEPQNETYFGGLNPADGRYTHGVQKGSMGNAQSYFYTNYGTGIFYGAPNGNNYLIIIKVKDLVFTFRLSGGFTDFPNLSLSLRYISK